MSTTDRTPSVRFPDADDVSAPQLARRTAASASAAFDGAVRVGETVAFWLAALLPLAYLPALVSGAASTRPLLLAGLILAHAASLALGRGYATDASDPAGR
ncbi:hypothetical protein [Halobaculum roseum]|uniref:Uncharacterized protein n=1 Tax=Halobaculum roseum TaxID=2175149 RepID=A0ABD5MT09_9EURY|nr:hypothetical protein [Halobaculum roseum]QZY01850.1 hypothetical protein K6T36_11035 [Halobaculum roseum]